MTPHFGCLTTSCLAQEIPDLFLGINRVQRLVPWTTVTMVKRRGLMLSVLQGGTLFWTQDHRLQSCSKKLVCLTVFVRFVAGTLPHLCSFLPPLPGLTLSVSAMAAVSDDVSISVNRLLDLPWGELHCKLNTGDGHIISLHSPEGWVVSCADRLTDCVWLIGFKIRINIF